MAPPISDEDLRLQVEAALRRGAAGRTGVMAILVDAESGIPPVSEIPQLGSPWAGASATDVVELCLGAAAAREAEALVVEPLGGEHAITLAERNASTFVAILPQPIGDAVCVRLAFLGGVDPWGDEARIGRLRTTPAGVEFLVLTRSSPAGFAAEARRSRADSVVPSETVGIALDQEMGRIGPYRVLGLMGEGSMGRVYQAVHETLGNPVALKILHAHLASDSSVSARFVREGRAASLANDPGIVNVMDFGTLANGRAYLVMELVQGPTLERVLAQGGFPPQRALKVALRMLLALQAAHVRGVIHRDLKPSNVFLVDAEDAIKIGDFGAAKVVSSSDPGATHDGVVVGTPLYMSPEHARGLATDERTDIYAVGCILFQMLTGSVPFPGRSVTDVILQHASAPVPRARSHGAALPDEVQRLVKRALAKQPSERYSGAGEMGADVRRALAAVGGR